MVAKIGGLVGAVALVGLLAGCERDLVLAGQRFDTRTPLDESLPAGEGKNVVTAAGQVNRAAPVTVGAAVANADWSQRGGSASRSMPNVALSGAPQLVWTGSIGAGESRRSRITTAPVVAGGRVFAMDSQNRLTALSATNGGQIWSVDVTAPGERSAAASGGGLAVADGVLYATTGFGELLALDPASGAIRWRQKFDGPASGAPAVAGGTVYVAGRDGAGWAVNAADGKLKWVQNGVRQTAGVQGGISPAVSDRLVVLPYSSGQLIAVDRAKGEPVWQGAVVGQRAGRAAAFLSDLAGEPVIAGNTVYAGSNAGRTYAFDARTGGRLWEAKEGSMGPVATAGNAVFLVSDEGRLVRLDAQSGETVWSQPMGHFVKEKPRRQQAVVAHYGPVLAGGRLVVASSDGLVRFFAPDSGAALGVIEMRSGAVAPPAVAGGTLYVVTANGQVQAFR